MEVKIHPIRKNYLDNKQKLFTEANMWEFALDYLENFRADLIVDGCIDPIKAYKFLSYNIKKFTHP